MNPSAPREPVPFGTRAVAAGFALVPKGSRVADLTVFTVLVQLGWSASSPIFWPTTPKGSAPVSNTILLPHLLEISRKLYITF